MNVVYMNDEEYVLLPVPSTCAGELAPELYVLPLLEMTLTLTQRMLSNCYMKRDRSDNGRTRLLERLDMHINEIQDSIKYYQKLRNREVDQALDTEEEIPF